MPDLSDPHDANALTELLDVLFEQAEEIAALDAARARGIPTALLCCNPQIPDNAADYCIALPTGPEVLPGSTRQAVREGDPHLLVNITNDAWSGDTHEPWIHLALAKFRAVEHHRALVRSTNSGVSARPSSA